VYIVIMQRCLDLKRYNVFLDTQSLKALAKIGESKGLKVAQVIRVAIAEYISRAKKDSHGR
jgi:hypothetical protein